MEPTVNFVQTYHRPKNASGPSDWMIEDWMEKGRPVYIKGVCRTSRESGALVRRIAKAMDRAYRLGVKHGKQSNEVKTQKSLAFGVADPG